MLRLLLPLLLCLLALPARAQQAHWSRQFPAPESSTKMGPGTGMSRGSGKPTVRDVTWHDGKLWMSGYWRAGIDPLDPARRNTNVSWHLWTWSPSEGYQAVAWLDRTTGHGPDGEVHDVVWLPDGRMVVGGAFRRLDNPGGTKFHRVNGVAIYDPREPTADKWQPLGSFQYNGTVYKGHVEALAYDPQANDLIIGGNFGGVYDARLGLWLPALLDKQLLLNHATADGVRFDLVTLEEPPPAPAPNGWTLVGPAVDVLHVERFAVDGVSLTGGHATVDGRFDLELGGALELSELDVDWDDGVLAYQGVVLADAVTAEGKAWLGPLAPGADAVDTLRLDVEVDGNAQDLSALRTVLLADWIDSLGGSGTLTSHVVLDGGALGSGTALAIEGANLGLGALDFVASGQGKLSLPVDQLLATELTLSEVTLSRGGESWLRGEGFTLRANTTDLTLADGLDGLHTELDLEPVVMPDITVLQDFLPHALVLHGGTLTAQAKLVDGVDGVKGQVVLEGAGLKGKWADLDVHTGLEMHLLVTGGELEKETLQLGPSTVALVDCTLTEDGRSWEWGAIATLEGAKLDLGSPVALDAGATLALPDASGILAVVDELSGWIQVFRGVLDVKDLQAHTDFSLHEGTWDLRNVALTGRGLDGGAEIELLPESTRALLWARLGPIGVGVESLGTTPPTWSLVGAHAWFLAKQPEFWTD